MQKEFLKVQIFKCKKKKFFGKKGLLWVFFKICAWYVKYVQKLVKNY